MGNPLLGVIFHWLGGLGAGSFYVPFKGVRHWSWETYWLAGGLFSWLIAPWVAALLLSENVLGVLAEASSYDFWMTYFMGVLWGLGGLTFGLTMRYLGLSLGMAVALGYCAAFGTLIPPLASGEFAGKLLEPLGGRIVLAGVALCLFGIFMGGVAGVRKERESTRTDRNPAIKEFHLTKGLLIATFSGIMSACFSFGFRFGEPISQLAIASGTGTLWAGLPVLIVILLGGLTTNFIWCAALHCINGSGREYFNATRRSTADTVSADRSAESSAPVPLLRNWLFCALAGTTWYLQFFFYQMGESQMGDYRFSSWTLHMASIIIFSTLWGIAFREWRGVSRRTRWMVLFMLLALVGSTIIIGWGNSISANSHAP